MHLAAGDPWPTAGVVGGRAGLVGVRSCHTVAELVAAATGAPTRSPTRRCSPPSKPGYGPALGLEGLAAGCRAVPGLPVLALGGVSPPASACLDAGAAGVALMGAVMRADDPAAVVRDVVVGLQEARA